MNKLLTLSALSFLLLFSCDSTQKLSKNDTDDQQKQQIASETELQFMYAELQKGGDVKLKNRMYYLDTPLRISNKDSLTLDGNGSTFIMKNKSEDVVVVENSSNITLKNFKATHIEPEGPIGCTGSVIQVYNNNGVLIEKCELNGSGIIGIVSYNTKDLKVVGNYIYNNSKYGVLYDEDTTLEINNNKFEDNGEDGTDHVVKALNVYLSEVEKIEGNLNKGDLKMSDNVFK